MKKVDNKVIIEGYLKENTLTVTRNEQGNEIIRGNLVIATDAMQSFKVQFYTTRYKKLKQGETIQQENKNYTALLDLLKENTVTLASLFNANSNVTFDQVKDLSTKVWAMASFSEFAHKDDNGEIVSTVTLKGITTGIKNTDKKPFEPKAEFTVQGYIYKKATDAKERVLLTCLIPEFDDSVSEITFVTGSNEATEYVGENFEIGHTVELRGNVINIVKKEVKAPVATANSFGRPAQEQYETTFINERQILGGTGPWDEDDSVHGITKAEIVNALENRQKKIDATPIRTSEVATAAPKQFKGFQGSESTKAFAFNGTF